MHNLNILNNRNINAENLKKNFDLLHLKNDFELLPQKGNIPKRFKKSELIIFYDPNAKWICVYYDYNAKENIIKDISTTFKTTAILTSIFDNENLSMFLSDATAKTNVLNAGIFLEDVEFDENSELDFDENDNQFTNENENLKTNITIDMWNTILNPNNTFDELQSLLKEEYIFYEDLLYEISDLIGLDTILSNCDYENIEEIFDKPENISNYKILRLSYIFDPLSNKHKICPV